MQKTLISSRSNKAISMAPLPTVNQKVTSRRIETSLLVACLTALVAISYGRWVNSADNSVAEITGTFAGLSYVETITGNGEVGSELPMLIALHYMSGSPETSIADYGDIDVPVRLLSLAGPHQRNGGYSWFPDNYYDLDVAEQRNVTFDVANSVATFIREAMETYPTRGKPVLTGFSQGADITHVVALRESGLLLAGLPMAGRFPESWLENGAGETRLPSEIVLFHGAADTAVSVGESLAAATYYTTHEVTVTLHTYDGAGHAFPERMKSDYKNVVERLMRSSDR